MLKIPPNKGQRDVKHRSAPSAAAALKAGCAEDEITATSFLRAAVLTSAI